MWTKRSTTRVSRTDLIFRSLWLALVGIHIAPLLAVVGHCLQGPTAPLLFKALGILISMGFFGAKAAGAPFLRVRCRVTGAVVFLAACSFVHQDVRQQVYSDPAAAVTLAAVAAIAKASSRLRIWPKLLGRGSEFLARLLNAHTWRSLHQPPLVVPILILESASTVPRGPPAA